MPDINPGIRLTVGMLNAAGHKTTDSGDGETRSFMCERREAAGHASERTAFSKEIIGTRRFTQSLDDFDALRVQDPRCQIASKKTKHPCSQAQLSRLFDRALG